MAEPEMVAVDGRGCTLGVRRAWSRAFTIMLVFLLAAAIATFAGVRQLVSEFSGTAHQLEREWTVADSLRRSLAGHEAAARQLLSGAPVDRQAFLREQDQISVAFRDALGTFPADRTIRSTRPDVGGSIRSLRNRARRCSRTRSGRRSAWATFEASQNVNFY